MQLVENEDRLTKSVFLNFSLGGKFKGAEFANTVIRSDKRLTYKQAYTHCLTNTSQQPGNSSYHPLTKLDPLGESLLIFLMKRSECFRPL